MSQFTRIASSLPVAPLVAQLAANSWLWNEHPERLRGPHRESQDIWVRYRAKEELICASDYLSPHWSVWYPAAEQLPAARDLALSLLALTRSTHLAGVLLTKLPPGGRIHSHDDRGTWHSEQMDLKIWTIVQGNEGCINECAGETAHFAPGEAWTFSNLLPHSVENLGESERICLITCLRTL